MELKNGLKVEALLDCRAYASAIAESESERFKQQAPTDFIKIDERPNFQVQFGIG